MAAAGAGHRGAFGQADYCCAAEPVFRLQPPEAHRRGDETGTVFYYLQRQIFRRPAVVARVGAQGADFTRKAFGEGGATAIVSVESCDREDAKKQRDEIVVDLCLGDFAVDNEGQNGH